MAEQWRISVVARDKGTAERLERDVIAAFGPEVASRNKDTVYLYVDSGDVAASVVGVVESERVIDPGMKVEVHVWDESSGQWIAPGQEGSPALDSTLKPDDGRLRVGDVLEALVSIPL